VTTISGERGDTVALDGWSLGGVLSRAVARAAPDVVRRIVRLVADRTGVSRGR